MYPLHDKDLDRLSREAAEQFEVEPGISGWDHLEKRLDQELPQKKDRRRFLFWLFLITITTGGILTGILKNNMPATSLAQNAIKVSSPADKTIAGTIDNAVEAGNAIDNNKTDNSSLKNNTTADQQTITSKAQQTESNPPATTQVTDKASPQQATTNRSKPVIARNNQQSKQVVHSDNTTTISSGNKTTGSKKAKSNTASPVIDNQPVGLNYAITKSNGVKNNLNTTPRYKQPKIKQGSPQRTHNDQPAADANTTTDKDLAANDHTTGNPVVGNDASSGSANTTDATSNAPVPASNKTTVPPAADSANKPAQQPAKEIAPKKINNYKQPLEIGLIAGPDGSTIEFGPLYKPGFNIGLQVGYRFNNRWSVNTAVIYTRKFYKADSQYFHPKTNWNPWRPTDIDGNCSMWEIPVNVRYDIAYNEKRRWFVSTGLSTYLMDKEDYNLNYVWSGGTNYNSYKSDSNSNYLFSILNLSVGFERSLGKHFSIQAEPYLKIPMKGLGYGNMRMDSYGVYFSLKYKPTFRSKK